MLMKHPISSFDLFSQILFKDLLTLKDFVVYILSILLLPLLSLLISSFTENRGAPCIENTSLFNYGNLGILMFFGFSVIIPYILSINLSSYISSRFDDSFPLKSNHTRGGPKKALLIQILAVFTYSMLLSISSLTIFCLVSLNLHVLFPAWSIKTILPFFLIFINYSFLIVIFFEAFMYLLIYLLREPSKIRNAVVELSVFLFVLLTIIKPLIIYASGNIGELIYDSFIAYIDLSYHFGNSFLFFTESYVMLSKEASYFFLMMGVRKSSTIFYNSSSPGHYFEPSSGITPLVSMGIILGVSMLLFLLSIKCCQLPRLERRGLWFKSPSILLKASGSSSSTSKGLIDT
ncbi:MAG: membrane protein of unknown function [Promethearchaeota archaeon]|nr:MAG: membrane protein of unknown function [Candidatus Lokiarchaeota archaeon]